MLELVELPFYRNGDVMLYFQKADAQGNVLTGEGEKILTDIQSRMQRVETCRRCCQLLETVVTIALCFGTALVIYRIPIPQRLDLLAAAIVGLSVIWVTVMQWGVRPYVRRRERQAIKRMRESFLSLDESYPGLRDELDQARGTGLRLPPEIREAWEYMYQE